MERSYSEIQMELDNDLHMLNEELIALRRKQRSYKRHNACIALEKIEGQIIIVENNLQCISDEMQILTYAY